jgi:hypothetical protein
MTDPRPYIIPPHQLRAIIAFVWAEAAACRGDMARHSSTVKAVERIAEEWREPAPAQDAEK